MKNFPCFLLMSLAVFGAESSVVRKNTKELLQPANDLSDLQMGDKYFLFWEKFVLKNLVRGDLLGDSDNNKEHTQDMSLSVERDDRNDQLGYPELICYLGNGLTPKKISCTGSCYLAAYWGPLGYHIERGCASRHHNTRTDKRYTRYCNTNLCNLK